MSASCGQNFFQSRQQNRGALLPLAEIRIGNEGPNSTWTQGPDMTYGRWYPTNVLMPDGTVLILSGFDSEGLTNVHPMEQYDPVTDTISVLPASANTPQNTDTYPRMQILPTGQIFNSGQRSDTQMYDPVAQK